MRGRTSRRTGAPVSRQAAHGAVAPLSRTRLPLGRAGRHRGGAGREGGRGRLAQTSVGAPGHAAVASAAIPSSTARPAPSLACWDSP